MTESKFILVLSFLIWLLMLSCIHPVKYFDYSFIKNRSSLFRFTRRDSKSLIQIFTVLFVKKRSLKIDEVKINKSSQKSLKIHPHNQITNCKLNRMEPAFTEGVIFFR